TDDEEYANPVPVAQAANAVTVEMLRKPAMSAASPAPSNQPTATPPDAAPGAAVAPRFADLGNAPAVRLSSGGRTGKADELFSLPARTRQLQWMTVSRVWLAEIIQEKDSSGEKTEFTSSPGAELSVTCPALNLEQFERALDDFFAHIRELQSLVLD